ncbi:hypothetical protein HY312_04830, partial [Candidatus Saccharibacteria bacterium]|nr:hypothetical protein [Candidatus Saccharibacteria bacterium]
MTPVQVDAGDLSIREVSTKPSWKANPISWNLTLADATPTLEIGTSKNALKTNDSVTKQDDGSYIASPKNLTPGVRYYYLITATANNDPLKKATYSGAFTTRGYPTSLVFTHDDKPVTGAKVTIENGSYTTDKNGSIELELSNKQYSASVTTGDGVTEKVQFTVAKKASVNGSDPEKQTFNFTILKENATDQPALPLGLIAATGAGVFVMAASFIGFLLYRRRHAEQLAVPSTFTDEYSWEAPLPENRAMEPQQYTPYPAANLQSPMNSTDQNIVDTEQFNDTPYPQQTIESSAEVLEVPNQIPFEQRYSEPELSVDPLVDELSQPTVSQPQRPVN